MALEVLILGGTAEAAELGRVLAADRRFRATVSLAGRTRDAGDASTGARIRIGGFGGASGLAAYLAAEGIGALVDATHAFATRISANAAEAATLAAVPRLALLRPPWLRSAGDDWREVACEEEAAAAVPSGARALLALGRQHLAPFAARRDVWWLVRVVDPPEARLLPGPHEVIVGRGPFPLNAERALLVSHRISHVVARNSGGAGARAKIDAARELGLPAVMIARPPPPAPPVVESVGEVVDWLTDRLR